MADPRSEGGEVWSPLDWGRDVRRGVPTGGEGPLEQIEEERKNGLPASRPRATVLNRGTVVFHAHPQGAQDSDGETPFRQAITLPESTHTFLFTEKVLSASFVFAVGILAITITCLILALIDNLDGSAPGNPLGVPSNVSGKVRAAQIFSVIIAILMEEEVPTALYLLRVIPRSSVRAMGFSYGRFVVSAAFRLVIGYLFLTNVYLVIVQSDRVLDIFYDILALQFVSMIDDIAFRLAQLDILGKHLREAAAGPCFRTEFERKPYAFRKKMTIFVKVIFVLNLVALLVGVSIIASQQNKGDFHCISIAVEFGDDVWEHAWMKMPTGPDVSTTLVYSFFNGNYGKSGVHAGRPVYTERRKSEDSDFATTVGAKISYCEEEQFWMLTHENIRKVENKRETPCPWLLRSPQTEAFDLLDVSGPWKLWVGVVEEEAQMLMRCNECETEIDCNLNGVCGMDGSCVCTNPIFEGMHCELEVPCPRIVDELDNATWTIRLSDTCDPLYEYGRPLYFSENADPLEAASNIRGDNAKKALLYSGSHWMTKLTHTSRNRTERNEGEDHYGHADFHAFWDKELLSDAIFISDPTKKSSPVGVDFYKVGEERGDQYGPFGVLYPLQEPPGRGFFRCAENVTMAGILDMCKKQNRTGRAGQPV